MKEKPILLKIAPDLHEQQLDIISIVKSSKIEGVIATNTTIDRKGLKSFDLAEEKGGLSGNLNASKYRSIGFLSKTRRFPYYWCWRNYSIQDA